MKVIFRWQGLKNSTRKMATIMLTSPDGIIAAAKVVASQLIQNSELMITPEQQEQK